MAGEVCESCLCACDSEATPPNFVFQPSEVRDFADAPPPSATFKHSVTWRGFQFLRHQARRDSTLSAARYGAGDERKQSVNTIPDPIPLPNRFFTEEERAESRESRTEGNEGNERGV